MYFKPEQRGFGGASGVTADGRARLVQMLLAEREALQNVKAYARTTLNDASVAIGLVSLYPDKKGGNLHTCHYTLPHPHLGDAKQKATEALCASLEDSIQRIDHDIALLMSGWGASDHNPSTSLQP
jgi:hypothetical protein